MMVSIAIPGTADKIASTPPVAMADAIPPAVSKILTNLHPYLIFL